MNAVGSLKSEDSLGNNLLEDLTLALAGCGLVNRDILDLTTGPEIITCYGLRETG